MYNVILFDLDGTLTESENSIINSIIYALNKLNIPVENRDDLKKFIGPPLDESFKKYYGFDDESVKDVISIYREYFSTKGLYEAPLYDGVEDMLKALKNSGKSLYVATSKPEVFSRKILSHIHIDEYFSDIVGATLDGSLIKKNDIIDLLLRKNNITDKSEVIMVGDREHDVIGAKKIGVDSIGVLYGYGSLRELEDAGATYLADSPGAVADIILGKD